MKDQLYNDLKELSLKITTLDNTSNIAELKAIAQTIYERLTVLQFVSDNINTIKTDVQVDIPTQPVKTSKDVIETIAPIQEALIVEETVEIVTTPKVEATPQKEEPSVVKDFLSKEEVNTIFDQDQWVVNQETAKTETTIEKPIESAKPTIIQSTTEAPTAKSLNSALTPKTIVVGLNDRIAFVKHLFNQSQADFNRVLSQLNTIDNEQAAIGFINTRVKPDYDWSGKEEYIDRLMGLINRRFS